MPIKRPEYNLKETQLIKDIERISEETLKLNKSLIIESIGDDCAIVADRDNLLVSTDSITENVHFTLKNYSFFEIGSKSLLVNLSDIAAMGGNPRMFTLSLFIPKHIDRKDILKTLEGIIYSAKKYGVSLIGGNISRALEYSISITIIGDYKNGEVIRRTGGKPGNDIFISGSVGNSWLAYHLQNNNFTDTISNEKDREIISKFIKKFKLPTPRIELGKELSKAGIATAMTDLSDGIYKDINNIANNGAEIWIDRLPLDDNLRYIVNLLNIDDYIKNVISFGEDYELLWTADCNLENDILSLSKKLGINITKIGRINEQQSGIKYLSGINEFQFNDPKTFNHL